MARTRLPFLIALPLAPPETAARNSETGDDDRLVEVRKIWERVPHNEFTDLTHLPIAASRTPARLSDRGVSDRRAPKDSYFRSDRCGNCSDRGGAPPRFKSSCPDYFQKGALRRERRRQCLSWEQGLSRRACSSNP